MTPKAGHWLVAVAFSFALHLVLAAAHRDEPEVAALGGDGGEGIEIGLALGDPVGERGSAANGVAEAKAADSEEITPVQEQEIAQQQPPEAAQESQAEPKLDAPVAPVLETVVAPAATDNLVTVERQAETAAESPMLPPANSQREMSTELAKNSNQNQADKLALGGASGRSGKHPGSGNARNAAEYFGEVMLWMNQHKHYPVALKQKKQKGVVEVEFTLVRSGEVTHMRIVKSGGHQLLDQAALQMLKDAAPLPPIPAFIAEDSLTLVIPVEYSLITN
ncbi:MAG: energy transducer TonB [Porticoccaceae bacterium]